MGAEEASDAKPQSKPPRRGRKRRIFALCFVGLWLLVGGAILYLSLAGATLRAPDWAATRIERALNERMGGAQVDLSEVDLIFDTRLRPRVQMKNVAVSDQNGTEIAFLDQISARLVPQRFFQGAATMRALHIDGAIITVRRTPSGQFDLVFGGGPGAQGDLASVLDSLDQAFSVEPLAALGEITVDHVTISLEDARTGRLWQVTDGQVALLHTPQGLEVEVRADVFNGTDDLASTVIGFQTEKGSTRALLTATFENALATDIAAQSPVLGFLSVLDAPISGALLTTIGADGQIAGLSGMLDVGAGALSPNPDAPPIPFDLAQASLSYDPLEQQITFSDLRFESEAASVTGRGTALFQDFRDRWPASLVGQFQVSNFELQPQGIFAAPMKFAQGALEFRLKLDPFAIDIGQVSLGPPEERVLAKGRLRTSESGWNMGLDISLNQITKETILELWPVAVAKGARAWVTQNVLSGEVSGLDAAFRFSTGERVKTSLSFQFKDARVKALKFLPPVTSASGYASLNGTVFTTVIETGEVVAPSGGATSVAGSYFKVLDLSADVEEAEVHLVTEGPLGSALSLLNQPPLSVLDKARMEAGDVAGRARTQARFSFPLVDNLLIKDVTYTAEGQLLSVSSDTLIEDRRLTAEALTVRASPDLVEISGASLLEGLPVNGTWSQPIGPDSDGTSQFAGTFELGQPFLEAFNIALPPGTVSGAGVGEITVDLAPETPPRFRLTSDLNRLGLRLPALGWSKPANRTGRLEVVGQLGPAPRIDRISLDAAGLQASGLIDLTPEGGLRRAQFDRVRVGGWLDGPVTLTGRGNAPVAVSMTSGAVDLRQAELGAGESEGGPLALALDRLTISDGIVLTRFKGDFRPGRGLSGPFSALVNGGAAIQGAVTPTPLGAAIQIRSDKAGEVFASAGILRNARGGALDLTLNPAGRAGVYNGRMLIRDTRLFGTPALTDLLNAISIVGLLDQVNTGGITMTDVEAEFQLAPDRVTLLQMSATGPSIGISLDGVYGMETGRLDMQGVLSPVYFLNGLGQVFSRGREGLFGFNFRMTGAADNPRVSVNPLSILTPGAFREIFRRPAPQPSQ